MKMLIRSFIHSFIQQIFIEPLLFAEHWHGATDMVVNQTDMAQPHDLNL